MSGAVAHGALDYAELAACGLRPGEVLDFSSNINPLGPPPAVRAALAAYDPAPYPDRACLELRAAIARRHGCAPDEVLAGNGSNELIHLVARALLRAGDRSLVIAPTFGEYAHAARLCGAAVIEWRAAEPDFVAQGAPDAEACARLIRRERPRLTWLCNPNNPTGAILEAEHVAALAEACAEVGGRLVVDRAYAALLRPANRPAAAPRPAAAIELHSPTKSYALAGLRLGYLLADAALVAQIAAYQPSWSVNGAAQAAGLAALGDAGFLARTLPRWWRWSDDLRGSLGDAGLDALPSYLPFFLVRAPAAPTRAALLRGGCLVRDCGSFGLPELVRVSPRRPADNARLVDLWRTL